MKRNVSRVLLATMLATAGCNQIFGLDAPHYAPPTDGSAGASGSGIDAPADTTGGGIDAPADMAGGAPDTGPDVPADMGTNAVDAATGIDASDGGSVVHGGPPLTPTCQGTAGPAPVNIEGLFCIDSTEVTNAQYAEFLGKVTPNDIVQPAACQWNHTFQPPSDTWPSLGNGDVPVVALDYCDGWSYCHWAGKRLCGRVGHTTATTGDVLNGEMYYACKGGANHTYTYSYGDTYEFSYCDTDDPDAGTNNTLHLDPVKSNPNCVSNVFSGLYDLSGPLEAWLDMCDPPTGDGSQDLCKLSTPLYGDFRCNVTGNYLLRSYQSSMNALRCCSDVIPPPG